jgi:hypothetical protein
VQENILALVGDGFGWWLLVTSEKAFEAARMVGMT